jgi:hypothetical protein
MKTKIPHLILAGILGTSIASQAAVVYQSDFTGADLASAGLASAGGSGGIWSLNTTDDRAQITAAGNPARASLWTSDAFQSELLTLDVTFLQTGGSRFTFGLVDEDYTILGGNDWLNQAMPNAYGIGISSAGWFEGGTDPFTLGFNDGSASFSPNDFTALTTLSQDQGPFSTGILQTMSITVTADTWSYSLNGAEATTGSFSTPFDTSRDFRFIAYAQTANGGGNNANGSYFSNITISVPEPSSTALLGLGGLALMLRRKRS